MNETVDELRDTAVNATYSSDREDAIRQLAEVFPAADDDTRDTIGRVLAQIAVEATYSDERVLAQETLNELLTTAPSSIASHVVTTNCRLALNGARSAERKQALGRLREYQTYDLSPALCSEIRESYLAVIDEATHEEERRRARDALAVLKTDQDGGSGPKTRPEDSERTAYLAVSLAEHLDRAKAESSEECQRRLKELRAFVEDSPVDDEEYEDVLSELTALSDQMTAVPTVELDSDSERRERIGRVADRVRRMYLRA